MTLPDQISLCNAMIKENKDRTVRDFLEAMKEIDDIGRVEKAIEKIKKVATPKHIASFRKYS